MRNKIVEDQNNTKSSLTDRIKSIIPYSGLGSVVSTTFNELRKGITRKPIVYAERLLQGLGSFTFDTRMLLEGAAIGAGLGTVVPVIGTIAGAIAGALGYTAARKTILNIASYSIGHANRLIVKDTIVPFLLKNKNEKAAVVASYIGDVIENTASLFAMTGGIGPGLLTAGLSGLSSILKTGAKYLPQYNEPLRWLALLPQGLMIWNSAINTTNQIQFYTESPSTFFMPKYSSLEDFAHDFVDEHKHFISMGLAYGGASLANKTYNVVSKSVAGKKRLLVPLTLLASVLALATCAAPEKPSGPEKPRPPSAPEPQPEPTPTYTPEIAACEPTPTIETPVSTKDIKNCQGQVVAQYDQPGDYEAAQTGDECVKQSYLDLLAADPKSNTPEGVQVIYVDDISDPDNPYYEYFQTLSEEGKQERTQDKVGMEVVFYPETTGTRPNGNIAFFDTNKGIMESLYQNMTGQRNDMKYDILVYSGAQWGLSEDEFQSNLIDQEFYHVGQIASPVEGKGEELIMGYMEKVYGSGENLPKNPPLIQALVELDAHRYQVDLFERPDGWRPSDHQLDLISNELDYYRQICGEKACDPEFVDELLEDYWSDDYFNITNALTDRPYIGAKRSDGHIYVQQGECWAEDPKDCAWCQLPITFEEVK